MNDSASAPPERGVLIPIGGAEERSDRPIILRRFVELCGGADASIVIIPTASRMRDTGSRYEDVFHTIGARRARSLPFRRRSDAERRELCEAIETATGIFLTGGNQSRLTRVLLDTPAGRAIHASFARGVHVAGTSAGAAVLSERMIAWGESGHEPHSGMVLLEAGFGLTRRFVVDQHFSQRERLGRLVTAMAANPDGLGIGVDEDTAAFIAPDDAFTVVGTGSVTVVEPLARGEDAGGDAASVRGVDGTDFRLHVLRRGETFDSDRRQVRRGPTPQTSETRP